MIKFEYSNTVSLKYFSAITTVEGWLSVTNGVHNNTSHTALNSRLTVNHDFHMSQPTLTRVYTPFTDIINTKIQLNSIPRVCNTCSDICMRTEAAKIRSWSSG